MNYFSAYTADGAIVRVCSYPEGLADIQTPEPEEAGIVFEQTDPETQYVDTATGTVVERPTPEYVLDKDTVIADGVDQAQVTGLPIPAYVYVNGPVADQFQVDDGSLALTFDEPGVYTVVIAAFPYQDYEVEIIAA